jgi:hypothetical protein
MPTLKDYLQSAVAMLVDTTAAISDAHAAAVSHETRVWLEERAQLLDEQVAAITRDVSDSYSIRDTLEDKGLEP